VHFGEPAVEAVREAGFALACSAMPGLAGRDSDPLQLPRLAVGNWDEDRLEREVSRLVQERRRVPA
jgi:hypothetical protein